MNSQLQEELGKYYEKSLYDFRNLELYKYKGETITRGLVMAEIPAKEILDAGFWNNENLVNQYMPQSTNSTGSKIGDAVMEAVVENSAKKEIDKAFEKTSAKLVLFSNGKDDLVMGQLVFYNKSINRDLSKFWVFIGEEKGGIFEDTTCFHAHSGNKDFEDVININFGTFSEYKEVFDDKTVDFAFHIEKDEEGKRKDFLSIKFKMSLYKAELVVVDYLTNGKYWDAEQINKIEPLLETKARLLKGKNENNTELAEVEKAENKSTGIGCVTSIGIAILVGIIIGNADLEVNFWLGLLIVALVIIPIWLGSKMGKKKNKERRDAATDERERLRKQENKLDEEIVGMAF